jgi:hypothetical protein
VDGYVKCELYVEMLKCELFKRGDVTHSVVD